MTRYTHACPFTGSEIFSVKKIQRGSLVRDAMATSRGSFPRQSSSNPTYIKHTSNPLSLPVAFLYENEHTNYILSCEEWLYSVGALGKWLSHLHHARNLSDIVQNLALKRWHLSFKGRERTRGVVVVAWLELIAPILLSTAYKRHVSYVRIHSLSLSVDGSRARENHQISV